MQTVQAAVQATEVQQADVLLAEGAPQELQTVQAAVQATEVQQAAALQAEGAGNSIQPMTPRRRCRQLIQDALRDQQDADRARNSIQRPHRTGHKRGSDGRRKRGSSRAWDSSSVPELPWGAPAPGWPAPRPFGAAGGFVPQLAPRPFGAAGGFVPLGRRPRPIGKAPAGAGPHWPIGKASAGAGPHWL